MANTNLGKIPSSAGSTTTGTFSFWIKGNLATGSNQNLYSVSSGGNSYQMWINVNGQLDFHAFDSAYYARLHPSANLRDTNGWYHIVFTIDTNNATSGDRLRLYINGERYTGAWTAETYPSQGAGIIFAKDSTTRIGSEWDNTDYFGGLISHFHMIDGTAYDASAFGEYDANGVWKIKTDVSVTYGTNGFFILEDGTNLSGSTVQDQSGNGNNWPVIGGTLTNTEDNPSNVFATGNKLIPSLTTYTNGNLTISNGASWRASGSTLAVTQGKYYAEMKLDSTSFGATLGVEDMDLVSTWSAVLVGTSANGRGYYSSDGRVYNNGTPSSFGASYAAGDIIGIALDMDNKFVYFHKNGTYQNSGDPTSGGSGTGGLSLAGTTYCFAYAVYNSTVSLNFGNGYFGTTAVASAGTNASGIGIFEYDVPTGYTALSTKGLNL